MPLFPSLVYSVLGAALGPEAATILLSMVEPRLQQNLARAGLLAPGVDFKGRLTDILNDRVKFQNSLKAFLLAIKHDDASTLVDAILNFVGAPFIPDPEKKKRFVEENKKTLLSLAALFLGDKTFNDLYGTKGHRAILAKNIARVYAPYGVSGEKAYEYATLLDVLFRLNPAARQGFDYTSIPEIIESATKLGLLAPTNDLIRFTEQLLDVLKIYRYVYDLISQQHSTLLSQLGVLQAQQAALQGSLLTTSDENERRLISSQLSQITEQVSRLQSQLNEALSFENVGKIVSSVVQRYAGFPLPDVLRYLAADVEIRKVYPYGPFQAGLAAVGEYSLPAVTEAGTGYAQLDLKLMQSAARSTLGNILGATIRAVERLGVGGPLYELYERMKSGEPIGRISPARWVELAVASGLDPHTAWALLRQKNTNAAQVSRPEYLRYLRLNQYYADVYPLIQYLRQRYGNDEIARGALSEIAARWGYPAVGALDPGDVFTLLHSPLANFQALKALETALERGKFNIGTQYLGHDSFTARLMDVGQNLLSGKFQLMKDLEYLLNIQRPSEPQSPLYPAYKGLTKQFFEPGGSGFVGRSFDAVPDWFSDAMIDQKKEESKDEKSETLPQFGILG